MKRWADIRLVTIAASLSLLLLAGCELTISATVTPSVQIGTTVFSILRFTPPDQGIDVVFVADDGYGDLANQANRQTYLNDVANLIDEGFYQNNAIVRNIGLFNFYFSTAAGGDVAANTAGGICPTITWPNLADAAFAEMVVIVHRTGLRDCGGGARASTNAGGGNDWIAVHEFGHAAFGLPDEYCCDGGYFNLSPVLYNVQANCTGDAANAAWRNCQSFRANNGIRWWRSQNNNIDLMRDAGPTVWEWGPAGWAVLSRVLGGLPGATVTTPSVFAPTNWDWP